MGKLSKNQEETSKSIDAIERKPTPHRRCGDKNFSGLRHSQKEVPALKLLSTSDRCSRFGLDIQLLLVSADTPATHRAFPPVWRPTDLAHALFACLADKSTSGISLTVSGTLQSGIVTGKIRPKEPTTQTARADTSNIQFAHLISPVSYFHPPPPSFLLHCIGRSLHWPPENSGPLSSPGANCLHARHATIQIARTAPTATDPPKQGISIHH